MKTLLTIEEYKERIISFVSGIAHETINPSGGDWFKMEYIYLLVCKCLERDLWAVDIANQMFINVFGRDRNGRRWCDANIRLINKEEADAFNAQPWYADYNARATARWEKTYEMWPRARMGKDTSGRILHIEDCVTAYFRENRNVLYALAKEIFLGLYGHAYELDKNYRCK